MGLRFSSDFLAQLNSLNIRACVSRPRSSANKASQISFGAGSKIRHGIFWGLIFFRGIFFGLCWELWGFFFFFGGGGGCVLSPSLEFLSTPPPPGQVEIDLQQNVRLVERLVLRKTEVGNSVLTITNIQNGCIRRL